MSTLRKVALITGQYYHIYNRGIEKRVIFTNKREYDRMMEVIGFYRFANNRLRFSKYNSLNLDQRQLYEEQQKLQNNLHVEILAYCLMPNHFHFLLKQTIDHGISTFIADIENSYTKYFNTKHKRPGPLLQGTFKGVWIDSEEQLLHVSRYIHLNPVASSLTEVTNLDIYRYSSLPEYLDSEPRGICSKKMILDHFSASEDYRQFIHNQADYAKTLSWVEHVAIDH